MKPYKRQGPKESQMRNEPCPCGATKPAMVDGQLIDKPVKYKNCCRKRDWPKVELQETNSDNKVGG